MAGREGSRRIELPSEPDTLGWIATIVALSDPSKRRRREMYAAYAHAYKSLEGAYLPYAKRVAAKILWGQDSRGNKRLAARTVKDGREAKPYVQSAQMRGGDEHGVDMKAISQWAEDAVLGDPDGAWPYAITHLAEFRGDSKFSTWLNAIVYHKTMDVLRNRIGERMAAMKAIVTDKTEAPSPMEVLDDLQKMSDDDDRVFLPEVVMKAMAMLPPKRQEILAMSQSGQTYGQIAKTLGVTIEVVQGRLRRAAEELMSVYDDAEVAEGETATEQIRALDRALRELPVKQQEVVVLRQQGKSYAEMAKEIGGVDENGQPLLSVGTIMSRLYHARQKLEQLSGVVLGSLATAATEDIRGAPTGLQYLQRGRRRIRQNPGDDGVIYVEMEQDAYDLHDAGLISDKELRTILKQFNRLAEEGGGFSL